LDGSKKNDRAQRGSRLCVRESRRMRLLARCAAALFALTAAGYFASNASAQSAGHGEGQSYDAFVKDATPQRGLFTIWHKGGKIYLELQAAQLNRDYVQTIVPSSGLGGSFVVWGNTDHLPAELVRFEPSGNAIAVLWPNPAWVAPGDAPAERAISVSFPQSIVAVLPVVARDEKSGAVVVDAEPFLNDQLNLKGVLEQGTGPGAPWALDRERSYFGSTKAFPRNVVIEARQAWTTGDRRLNDVPADPRIVQMRVTYNIADPPHDDDYRPRLADDRIGIYQDVYLQFSDDHVLSRKLRYVVRWNIQPSDPAKPMSPAKHPMVFYMSNTVPERYRASIRDAVLGWNDAFRRLGIADALQVRDQPADPDWDPDDIRYNVLRWVPEANASFGADSQTLYDPRTGQEFRTGILISADVPLNAQREWTFVIDPERNGRATDPMPAGYLDGVWKGVILHETGHNLGMQHNFFGKAAYTARELQDPTFTAKNGITSTVMEYAPANVWPKGTSNGTFSQTVLGPYDYYLMHWTYAQIPGAATPEAEVPTLSQWASAWSDPRYRYASDEDVSWANGHAADPRVATGVLTNDALAWCRTQLDMNRALIDRLDSWFPAGGAAFEDETSAFQFVLGRGNACRELPSHYIGGQYLSRAHRGDPHADPPVVPVPRNVQRRAFDMVARDVFSDGAWRFAPSLLQHLGTSEWAGYGYVEIDNYGNLPLWAYKPSERHDIAPLEMAARAQQRVLDQMFQPLVLARLGDGPLESTERSPMRMSDLFDWMRASVFSELSGSKPGAVSPMRRNLQMTYARLLRGLRDTPRAGTPEEARTLAAASLRDIATACSHALAPAGVDSATRAHLEALAAAAGRGGRAQ
jgi:hypothetical protein